MQAHRSHLTYVLAAALVAACGGGGGGGSSAVVVELFVAPVSTSVPLGTSRQFTCEGEYSNGVRRDVSAQVTWSSSDPGVASIDANGLARTLTVGTTTISAEYDTLVSSTSLGVLPPALVSISVAPPNPSVLRGDSLAFSAIGAYTDASTLDLTGSATWSSSNTAVAIIAAGGVATAVQVGTTTIRASAGAISGTSSLTVLPPPLVALAVEPRDVSIARGLAQQFTATGTYSDDSTQDLTALAAWTSSIPSVATIAPGGLASALLAGVTTIRAAVGAVEDDTTFTVRPELLVSIEITPADAALARGGTLQLGATGHFDNASTQDLTASATWTTSDASVATVESAPPFAGRAAGSLPGSATIRASVGAVSGSTELHCYLPLAKTGQTVCHDELGQVIVCTGTGQDGELQVGWQWPLPRFTLGAGPQSDCVTDELTGLMWSRAPDGVTAWVWLDALSAARDLSLCGYDDWRLPSRRELRTLIHNGEGNTATWLGGQGFSVLSTDFWTSSTLASIPDNAWNTDMLWGVVDVYGKTGGPRLWVVRTDDPSVAAAAARTGQTACYDATGNSVACEDTAQDGELRTGVPWPEPRFEVGVETATGVVIDRLTGLAWERQPIAITRTWQQALDHARALVLGGFDDWRLPNVTELESLYNAGALNGATWLAGQGFQGVQSSYYWSSTTVALDPSQSWVVQLRLGYVWFQAKGTGHYVWAVRGP